MVSMTDQDELYDETRDEKFREHLREEEMSREEEYFMDWKMDNYESLLADYLSEHHDEFMAYCKEAFKERER